MVKAPVLHNNCFLYACYINDSGIIRTILPSNTDMILLLFVTFKNQGSRSLWYHCNIKKYPLCQIVELFNMGEMFLFSLFLSQKDIHCHYTVFLCNRGVIYVFWLWNASVQSVATVINCFYFSVYNSAKTISCIKLLIKSLKDI